MAFLPHRRGRRSTVVERRGRPELGVSAPVRSPPRVEASRETWAVPINSPRTTGGPGRLVHGSRGNTTRSV